MGRNVRIDPKFGGFLGFTEGGSASEFFKIVYYYGASPLDCRTTLRPIQRFNKEVGKAYWICEPSFQIHTEEEQAICDQVRDKLNSLYRMQLCNPSFHEIMAVNYNGCEFRVVEGGATNTRLSLSIDRNFPSCFS